MLRNLFRESSETQVNTGRKISKLGYLVVCDYDTPRPEMEVEAGSRRRPSVNFNRFAYIWMGTLMGYVAQPRPIPSVFSPFVLRSTANPIKGRVEQYCVYVRKHPDIYIESTMYVVESIVTSSFERETKLAQLVEALVFSDVHSRVCRVCLSKIVRRKVRIGMSVHILSLNVVIENQQKNVEVRVIFYVI